LEVILVEGKNNSKQRRMKNWVCSVGPNQFGNLTFHFALSRRDLVLEENRSRTWWRWGLWTPLTETAEPKVPTPSYSKVHSQRPPSWIIPRSPSVFIQPLSLQPHYRKNEADWSQPEAGAPRSGAGASPPSFSPSALIHLMAVEVAACPSLEGQTLWDPWSNDDCRGLC
jgi:hypothetical protein